MNNKFDELAKCLAQSVTRRQALRRFGAGLSAGLLASMGLGDKALADPQPKPCTSDADCPDHKVCSSGDCIHVRYHCRCGESDFGCHAYPGSYYDCLDYCGNGIGRHQCGGSGGA